MEELRELLIELFIKKFGAVAVIVVCVYAWYFNKQIEKMRELIRDMGDELKKILLLILAKI